MVSDSPFQRREVYYSGHVQGVGFRYTAQRVAKRYDVTGFVRNLPDRRVHVVVEGPRAEVQSFLDDLAGTMEGYIRDTVVRDSDALESFEGFEIRG